MTAEFLERWRVPGDAASRQWEERFGEYAYVPLAEAAIASALQQAGVTAGDLASVLVAGSHGRANKRAAAAVGAKPTALGDDLTGTVGNTGAAHAGLLLADALDRAQADDLIMVVSLADGCDVTIWRATAALARGRQRVPVAQQIKAGGRVSYPTFLTWRGFLKREPPRRPDPQAPAAPPAFRAEAWKFGFTGSRCQACGTRHLPPTRVCLKCRAVDRMTPERMADVPATIATYTVDRLAYSLSPPVVVGVLDFEGGGRFTCELTDVDPAAVKIGDRVEMTFRRLMTAHDVHNYFLEIQASKKFLSSRRDGPADVRLRPDRRPPRRAARRPAAAGRGESPAHRVAGLQHAGRRPSCLVERLPASAPRSGVRGRPERQLRGALGTGPARAAPGTGG